MNGKKARKLRKKVYGDYSHQDRKYEQKHVKTVWWVVNEYTGIRVENKKLDKLENGDKAQYPMQCRTRMATGLRREYLDAKRRLKA